MSILNTHFRFFIEGDINTTDATPTFNLRRFKQRSGEHTNELTIPFSTQVDNDSGNDLEIMTGFFLISQDSPTQREIFNLTLTSEVDQTGELFYRVTTNYRGVNPTLLTTPTNADSFVRNRRRHTDGATVVYIESFAVGASGAGDNLGNHTATQDIDMGGLKVVNAADPTNQQDLATKEYVDNQSNPFQLTIDERIASSDRVINWSNFPSVSDYEVCRNGIVLTTVNGNTYTDTDVLADGIYEYQVKALVTPNSASVGSNSVFATIGDADFSTFRGTGVDGTATGGVLTPNQTFNFTDINLSSNMIIDGNIVLVQGDVNLNGFSIISALSDGSSSQSVMVDGVTYNLEQSALVVSTGGTGAGGAAPNRTAAGDDSSTFGAPGQFTETGPIMGGAAPIAPSYEGNDGGTTAAPIAGGGFSVSHSGGGASHGWGHTPSFFAVGGNWDDTGSLISGTGSDGGNGGNGQGQLANASFNVVGGSGGGGGQGGDGLTLYIKVDGTVTNTALTNIIGGNGGAAGLPGIATNSGTGTATDGIAGVAGMDGLDGTINFI